MSTVRAASGAALALVLILGGCRDAPPPVAERAIARPALWHVTGPAQAEGWLFGTIHALPQPVAWRTPVLDHALAAADVLVLEIANLDDQSATAQAFERLGRSPGHPPVDDRVAPALRPALDKLMVTAGYGANELTDVETWAAALILARAADPGADSGAGIDRGLIALAGAKPRGELEGAAAQLGIFDALPEPAQRALLSEVVRSAATAPADDARLAQVWARGDVAALAAETHAGMLADPALRAALLVDRNIAWAARIGAMLRGRRHPFVAVGAAHMAGPDGLPALLAAQGWRVVRAQ